MKNLSSLTIKTMIALVAVVAIATFTYAWTAPTALPTGGNVPAPVNTGTFAQTKLSSFTVNPGNLTAKGSLFQNTGNVIADVGVIGLLGMFKANVSAGTARFGCPLSQSNCISSAPANSILEATTYNTSGASALNNGLTVDGTGKTMINGALQINRASDVPVAGQVLTTDAAGNATWENGVGNITVTKKTRFDGMYVVRKGVALSSSSPWPDIDSDGDRDKVVEVPCDVDSVVVGGGGICFYGPDDNVPAKEEQMDDGTVPLVTSLPITIGSTGNGSYAELKTLAGYPTAILKTGTYREKPNGWLIGCTDDANAATAYAICVPDTETVSDVTVGTVAGNEKVPYVADWHYGVPTDPGAGTCASAFPKTVNGYPVLEYGVVTVPVGSTKPAVIDVVNYEDVCSISNAAPNYMLSYNKIKTSTSHSFNASSTNTSAGITYYTVLRY